VKEIKRMNSRGEKAEELQPVELINAKITEIEPVFVDVVGQITLQSLEKSSNRKRDKEKYDHHRNPNSPGHNSPGQRSPHQKSSQNRPQQQRPHDKK
jgi:hypothetical protein